jgi:hypothetical protein
MSVVPACVSHSWHGASVRLVEKVYRSERIDICPHRDRRASFTAVPRCDRTRSRPRGKDLRFEACRTEFADDPLRRHDLGPGPLRVSVHETAKLDHGGLVDPPPTIQFGE